MGSVAQAGQMIVMLTTAVIVRVVMAPVVVAGMIVPRVVMPVLVFMRVLVRMAVPAVIVGMGVRVFMSVAVLVIVAMRPVDIKLHAVDGRLVRAVDVQVPVLVEREFAELCFELPGVHAEVDHRAEKHVAADAAEDVEVKGFHGMTDDKGPMTKEVPKSKHQRVAVRAHERSLRIGNSLVIGPLTLVIHSPVR
jgi:hypothetical protein